MSLSRIAPLDIQDAEPEARGGAARSAPRQPGKLRA
jgi:hypothetical protein